MINVTVAHDLPQEEALRRVRKFLQETAEKHGHKISDVSEEWNGNIGTLRFSVIGFPVSGTVTVGETVVRVVSRKLPFGVGLLKRTIEEKIVTEALRLFS